MAKNHQPDIIQPQLHFLGAPPCSWLIWTVTISYSATQIIPATLNKICSTGQAPQVYRRSPGWWGLPSSGAGSISGPKKCNVHSVKHGKAMFSTFQASKILGYSLFQSISTIKPKVNATASHIKSGWTFCHCHSVAERAVNCKWPRKL